LAFVGTDCPAQQAVLLTHDSFRDGRDWEVYQFRSMSSGTYHLLGIWSAPLMPRLSNVELRSQTTILGESEVTASIPFTANHDRLEVMSASDDALIIRNLIQSLEANLSELGIELGEEAPLESQRLDNAERILQNAIQELEALIKPEK
jgi:hypothetical protein